MSADIKEIYDEIYYGCDIELRYGGWCYMIGSGGISEQKKYFAKLARYKHSSEEDLKNEKQPVQSYEEYEKSFGNACKGDGKHLYYQLFDDPQTMTDTFLKEPLFDGKSFYEIAQDVEILTIF